MKSEESVFVEALGSSPIVRILDHLITGRELDFSLSNMAEGADVGWMTVHRVLPRLVKLGVVRHTRAVGQAKMYKINSENPVARELIIFYDRLIKISVDEALQKLETKSTSTATSSTRKSF